MLVFLLAANILAWLLVLAYGMKLIPALARRWRPWLAIAGVAAAAVLSVFSYQHAARLKVREKARDHYITGIGERRQGNIDEAKRHFDEALRLDPGNQEARRELEAIGQEKPAEKREQRREARIDPRAVPPSQPPENKPGKKPEPVPHKPSPFEITHYGLDVSIDPAAHTLDATATISVQSRGETVPVLEFSFNPEFKPASVSVDDVPASFTHKNDLLAVTPSRGLDGRGRAVVTIRYRREGGPFLEESGDAIHPRGTYLRSETRWYPATGELDFRAPVRVRATVPNGYTVVSVGALKESKKFGKTTLFHWETDRPASMVSLAAARYVQKSVQTLPPPGAGAPARAPLQVTCYTFPEHQDRAAAFLQEAAAVTRFFEQRFGPYPYEKLAVVEIPFFPGGYGTTSFVMLLDESFREKKIDREFLAHEIAHQWWGNSVFPQGLGAAWLTEAFANYSAWMYESAITGNPRVLQKRVARAISEYYSAVERKGDQAIDQLDVYQPVGATQQIVYEKGAVVLHMLHRQVGDPAFLRILRRFADSYRFGKASIADFRKVADQESGQRLGWFFDQWLGRTGGMAFSYSFRTEAESAAHNRAILKVTQQKPPYRARMKVVLQVENSAETREVELSRETEEFPFPVKGKLASVLFDPDNTYLMKPPRWTPEGK
jgi:aminopeptidase N